MGKLEDRRAFDLRVLSEMRCGTFDFEAYRTLADLQARRGRVTDPSAGAHVTHYRWIYRIRTHISKNKFSPKTEIGVNTDVTDYPRQEPGTWIISADVPWSPHFMKGAPVCIGPEIWSMRDGYITLGELAIHIAHMLNWDEIGRGRGYVGWNPAAVKHHRDFYGGKPINPDLDYPVLPAWLTGESQAPSPGFTVVDREARQDPGFRVHR